MEMIELLWVSFSSSVNGSDLLLMIIEQWEDEDNGNGEGSLPGGCVALFAPPLVKDSMGLKRVRR